MALGHQIKEANHELHQYELPRLLREISEVIGLHATIQLVARYGGTTINVPFTTRNNYRLAQILEPETIAKLIRRYAGTRLYIPKTCNSPRTARDIEIYQRYKQGLTNVNQIAREYGLSDRHVWKIIKNQRNAARDALKKSLNMP